MKAIVCREENVLRRGVAAKKILRELRHHAGFSVLFWDEDPSPTKTEAAVGSSPAEQRTDDFFFLPLDQLDRRRRTAALIRMAAEPLDEVDNVVGFFGIPFVSRDILRTLARL